MAFRYRESESGYYGYSYSYRKRRCKSDWAGLTVGDAFKTNLDYYVRLPAQRLFYRMMTKIQREAAALAGASVQSGFEPKVKPQLGPCYTNYPSTLAAHAALGLSSFLEFEAQSGEDLLVSKMASYLADPAAAEGVRVNREIFRSLAQAVARAVQTRILLEDLARRDPMSSIEIYRLFACSQQDLNFSSVPRIIRAVVLYGDLLPDWNTIELHPMTKSILHNLTSVSSVFFHELTKAGSDQFLSLGANWVRRLCRVLAKYLSDPEEDSKTVQEEGIRRSDPSGDEFRRRQFKFGDKEEKAPLSDDIAPLKKPRPPSLLDPAPSPAPDLDQIRKLLKEALDRMQNAGGTLGESPPSQDEEIEKIVKEFVETVSTAGGQSSQWEDMRSDLVEQALRVSDFAAGPIEGDPTQGHEVKVKYGENQGGGEVFERPEPLSEDHPAYQKLLQRARPITEQLRRTLYPNIEPVTVVHRFCASGSLDPAKLPVAAVQSAIWKRHRVQRRLDKRGRPLLVIACDGSGSLNSRQMDILKILCAAWLNATSRTGIEVLAALYHSGTIRQGVTGPLIRWVYHPEKTPATSKADAARALISLPDDGTGVQSDALSLTFIMDEAKRLARGKAIYATVISDCEWNRSFDMGKTGKEEVFCFFHDIRKELKEKLHTTLVALGVSGENELEHVVDKVIHVPDAQLADCEAVASQIGQYVASCIREREKLIKDARA